jgi:hypothetical protein
MPRKPEAEKPVYIQQVHADCGGQIVVVVSNQTQEVALACKACKALWEIDNPVLHPLVGGLMRPTDWRDCE